MPSRPMPQSEQMTSRSGGMNFRARRMWSATSSGRSTCSSTCARCRTPRLLLLEILRRRGVARVDRVLQEVVHVVGPELADVRIGLDHRVDQLAALLLDLADVDVADGVAVLVEAQGAAQRVRHLGVVQRLVEGL